MGIQGGTYPPWAYREVHTHRGTALTGIYPPWYSIDGHIPTAVHIQGRTYPPLCTYRDVHTHHGVPREGDTHHGVPREEGYLPWYYLGMRDTSWYTPCGIPG